MVLYSIDIKEKVLYSLLWIHEMKYIINNIIYKLHVKFIIKCVKYMENIFQGYN